MMSTCLPIISPLEYNPPRRCERDSFDVIILNVYYLAKVQVKRPNLKLNRSALEGTTMYID